MIKRLTPAIIFLVFSSSWARTPEQPPLFRDQTLRLAGEFEYFETDANYDPEGGSFEKLPDGRGLADMQFDISSRYSLNRRWNLLGGVGFGYVTSTTPENDRTNSTLTEASLGLQHLWLARPVYLVPEFIFQFPLNRIDAATDEAIAGEGAMVAQAGLWAVKRLWNMNHHLYVGARWQDEGRAALLPWQVGTFNNWGSVSAGANISGTHVLVDDENIGNPGERFDVVNRVNAGSLRYYSVNPSALEGHIWLGFRFNPVFELTALYGQTIDGKNSAVGSSLYLNLIINLNFKDLRNHLKNRKKRELLDDFNIEQPEYDESLFEAAPPSTPRRSRPPAD